MFVRWGVQGSTKRGFLEIYPIGGKNGDSHGKQITRGRNCRRKLKVIYKKATYDFNFATTTYYNEI